MKKLNIDWVIHLVANGACCEQCGEIETGFKEYLCNAHTHGMERYDHPDFQMVLAAEPNEIGRILNSFGLMVQNGYKFKDGEYVAGIYEDCVVRLQKFQENDREVLRVIIPDRNNIFPEDPRCEEPYCYQLLPTSELEEE